MIGKNDHGFTLIELAIYGGLLGILLVILSEFFVALLNVQLVSSADTAVDQDGKYIVARMSYDFKRAKAILAPSLGQAAATVSATINDAGTDYTYRYALTNTNLLLTVGASAATPLNSDATKVTSFSVSRIGNSGQSGSAKDTLQISFTLQSVASTSSGRNQAQYQTTVSLR